MTSPADSVVDSSLNVLLAGYKVLAKSMYDQGYVNPRNALADACAQFPCFSNDKLFQDFYPCIFGIYLAEMKIAEKDAADAVPLTPAE
jgi:hypothetical protein